MSIRNLLNRDASSPPMTFTYDAVIRKTPQEMIDATFPLPQNDRYALCAYLEEEANPKRFFFRIYNLYPSVRQAEMAAKDAINSGYNFVDLIVVDIRGWMMLPPSKFEDEKQANEV